MNASSSTSTGKRGVYWLIKALDADNVWRYYRGKRRGILIGYEQVVFNPDKTMATRFSNRRSAGGMIKRLKTDFMELRHLRRFVAEEYRP